MANRKNAFPLARAAALWLWVACSLGGTSAAPNRNHCSEVRSASFFTTYTRTNTPAGLSSSMTSCSLNTWDYSFDGACPTEFSTIYAHKWYTFLGQGQSVTVSTDGSNYDTRISVFRGSSCSSLSCIAYDDDSGAGLQSRVTFTALSGWRYYVRVDDHSCSLFNRLDNGLDAVTKIRLTTPTPAPTNHPTNRPTNRPTNHPTPPPTARPTSRPTPHPTSTPGFFTARPTTPPPTDAGNPAVSSSQSGDSSEGGSGGVPIAAIAGAAAGALFVVAAVAVWCCCCRKKPTPQAAVATPSKIPNNDEEQPSPTTDEGDEPDVYVPTTEPALVAAAPVVVVHAPAGPLGLTMSESRGPNGGHLVDAVKPNSALQGQVQVGDELMAVNAVDLTQQSMREMTETLRSTAGGTRELTLLRQQGTVPTEDDNSEEGHTTYELPPGVAPQSSANSGLGPQPPSAYGLEDGMADYLRRLEAQESGITSEDD